MTAMKLKMSSCNLVAVIALFARPILPPFIIKASDRSKHAVGHRIPMDISSLQLLQVVVV